MHPNLIKVLIDAADSLKEVEPLLASNLHEAISAVSKNAPVTNETLQAIAQAAASRSAKVMNIAIYVLGAVGEQDQRGMRTISSLFDSPIAEIRRNAILCLTNGSPRDEAFALLRNGLKDRSSLVRLKAADCAGRLNLKELLSDIQNALEREAKGSVREVMSWAVSTLGSKSTLPTSIV